MSKISLHFPVWLQLVPVILEYMAKPEKTNIKATIRIMESLIN